MSLYQTKGEKEMTEFLFMKILSVILKAIAFSYFIIFV